MDEISTIILNNIWLFLGLGVILIIVADEILGLSRGLLGDDSEEMPLKPRDPDAEPPDPLDDPLDHLDETSEGERIEDFLGRR